MFELYQESSFYHMNGTKDIERNLTRMPTTASYYKHIEVLPSEARVLTDCQPNNFLGSNGALS